ncbi:mitochondrial RNA ligase 2 [Leptomonas seymouri]|uniref:RNA ligase (ATP) n=1 Tax=Leptomonas seymouri TaxID=5684 RepID=A0A0N1HTX0_LEPSE|nr:mitochondrial RNA ligase 2 [Leptomonas seymouri]|eukprot:KPI83474.1 mitochondrial RNA ligase 2 [Leptomonas seymouri]
MFRRCRLARFLRRSPLLWADEKEQLFERYTEIENSNARRINGIKAAGLFNDEWIATEKVHGANFGIYSLNHGKALRYAKRSGIMPHNEHFFGYHVLIPDLTRYAQQCRELLTTQLNVSPSSIIVNGELFGGKYDHPNVPKKRQSILVGGKTRSISAVQNDPFPQYCPDLHFYAFDIKYKLTEEDAAYTTLTYDEATAIFEAIPGLLYAKAIIRGPLSKVAAFDVETFTTTIPPLVGMGNYPLKGNWAEGLVVKHHKRGKPGFDPAGITILKFKSTAFQEISTDRSQGPRVDEMEAVRRESIQVSGVQLPAIESVIRDPEVCEATQHLLNHVCENRLKSVLSKIGTDPFETQTMTPDALATLLAKDALKDFLKEAEPKIVNSPLLLRREITRYVLFESRKYVASKWKEVVAQQMETNG